MDIFRGLNAGQVSCLRRLSTYWNLSDSQVLFKEGDPSYGMFLILSGQIEIYKQTETGCEVLSKLSPGDIFGEMGLFYNIRTASARAVGATCVHELPNNPLTFWTQVGDPKAAVVFGQNLFLLLAERLHRKDAPDAKKVRSLFKPLEIHRFDPRSPIKTIESNLPTGIWKQFMRRHSAKPGDYLCRQGEASDGFFFLHEGTVEAWVEDPDSAPRQVNTVVAPEILGEIGFFAQTPRTASIKAQTAASYTHFLRSDFEKLCAHSPQDAFALLYASAQLAVHLIVQKESAP